MSSRNITPFVQLPVMLTWAVAVPFILVPYGPVGIGLAFIGGIVGTLLLVHIFEGERLWLAESDSSLIGYELIIKPRGFRSGTRFIGSDGDSDNTVECDGCGDDFDEVANHFKSDHLHYCPDCSHVGELVMNNYTEWFSTAQEVRQQESAD